MGVIPLKLWRIARRRQGHNASPPAHQPTSNTGYPGVAQIAGHALSGIFLDALTVNIERLQRVNRKPPTPGP